MTMDPPQSYRSPEPSGIRTNAVRLCVALLGFWVVASSLLLQSPVSPLSTPAAEVSSLTNVGLELLAVGLEKHGSEFGDCCPEVDCTDSQDCSLPCISSCPAPQVAVLESPLFGDLSNGANITSVVDNEGFASPVATLLFRPPIV